MLDLKADQILKPIGDIVTKALSLIPDKNKAAEIAKELELSANELEKTIQTQISERHKADMMSDSWLSKNIRPLMLVSLVGWYVIVFVLTYFGVEASETMIDLLKTLLVSAFQFYFGGRTIEKGASMIASVMKLKK